MDALEQKLRSLPEKEIPRGFHARVINYLSEKQLQAPFYFIVTLLFLNFAASVWNLVVRLIQQESVESLRASFEGFEFSAGFFSSLMDTVREALPGRALILFFINAALLAYFIYLIFKMKSIKKGRL